MAAYDPALDNVIAQFSNSDEGLTVMLASYNDGPVKVRLKRQLASGKLVDASPLQPGEVPELIELLKRVHDWDGRTEEDLDESDLPPE